MVAHRGFVWLAVCAAPVIERRGSECVELAVGDGHRSLWDADGKWRASLLDLVELNYGSPMKIWRNVGTGDAARPGQMGS